VKTFEKGEAMSMPIDWDPTPEKTKKLPALQVPTPSGVRPFAGKRNPMTRSNSAHRIADTIATPATNGVPEIYFFESEGEYAVALEAILDPELFALEVQLPAIRYPWKHNKKGYRDHFFDLRLTFDDGYRRAVYVKNGRGLGSQRVQEEIAAIFANIPEEFADDAIVVNTDDYSRAYKDNLRRLRYLSQKHAPEDDAIVEAMAQSGNYWFLEQLIKKCPIPTSNAWQAAMRLIARGVLGTNYHAVINLNSHVWLAA
jgi:hypothetical protein